MTRQYILKVHALLVSLLLLSAIFNTYFLMQKLFSSDLKQRLTECPEIPQSLLGNISVNLTVPDFSELLQQYCSAMSGGYWKPKACAPRYRIAFIIPFHNREAHLRILISNMYRIWQRQELEFGVYVVEPAVQPGSGHILNKGKILNIGFIESQKDRYWDCFVFHDVDLYLENDNALYACPAQENEVRLMTVAIDKFNYWPVHSQNFGGVTILTKTQMLKVNGYSNSFWGWGGEDDEMSHRSDLVNKFTKRFCMRIPIPQFSKKAKII